MYEHRVCPELSCACCLAVLEVFYDEIAWNTECVDITCAVFGDTWLIRSGVGLDWSDALHARKHIDKVQ